MFNRMKISAKIALSFAVLIAVMVVGSSLVLINISILKGVTQSQTQAEKINETLTEIGDAVDEQHAAILGLLVTGDRRVLSDFAASKVKFDKGLATLEQMAGADVRKKDLLSKLKAGYDRWNDEVAQKQITLTSNAMTVNEARAIEVSGRPAELMDQFRQTEQELSRIEKETLARIGDEAQTALGHVNLSSWISGILMALLAIAAGLMLTRLIATPIRSMSQAMLKLADGNTAVDIPGIGNGDEIGEMANAVQVFKDNKIKADHLAVEQQREQEVRAARAKRIEDLCTAFDATSSEAVKSVAAAAAQMQSSSEAMGATAEETTHQATAVAAASEQASANVETVASAAEELSSPRSPKSAARWSRLRKSLPVRRPARRSRPTSRCRDWPSCRQQDWRGGGADHRHCRANQSGWP